MFKKVLSLILCLCLTCTAFGCSQKKPPSQSEETNKENAQLSDNPSDTVDEETSDDEQNNHLYVPDNTEETLAAAQISDNRIALSGSNFDSSVFQLNGKNYKLPFSYARISNEWEFDLEDYGYDETFMLQPNERTTDTVELFNTSYDYTITVGFYNPYDIAVSIYDAMIWSVSVNRINLGNAPAPLLPMNITFGSDVTQVISAYNPLNTPTIVPIGAGTFEYHYRYGSDCYLILIIHKTMGVMKFTMQNLNSFRPAQDLKKR